MEEEEIGFEPALATSATGCLTGWFWDLWEVPGAPRPFSNVFDERKRKGKEKERKQKMKGTSKKNKGKKREGTRKGKGEGKEREKKRKGRKE